MILVLVLVCNPCLQTQCRPHGKDLSTPRFKIPRKLMGITSENIAACFGITRAEQDLAAVESHRRATAATISSKFKHEIDPVKTKVVDSKSGKEKSVTVILDEGTHPNITVSELGKLNPAFKNNGTTTAWKI